MFQMPKPSYCVRSRLNVHQGHSDSSWKKRIEIQTICTVLSRVKEVTTFCLHGSFTTPLLIEFCILESEWVTELSISSPRAAQCVNINHQTRILVTVSAAYQKVEIQVEKKVSDQTVLAVVKHICLASLRRQQKKKMI